MSVSSNFFSVVTSTIHDNSVTQDNSVAMVVVVPLAPSVPLAPLVTLLFKKNSYFFYMFFIGKSEALVELVVAKDLVTKIVLTLV